MMYTCVKAEVVRTGRRQCATFWFKQDPTCPWEKPRLLTTWDQHVVEELKAGNIAFFGRISAEVVTYPLPMKMRYSNGTITDTLILFCPKVPTYELHRTYSWKLTGWQWMKGYSPEEQAARIMHIMVPVQEQLANS